MLRLTIRKLILSVIIILCLSRCGEPKKQTEQDVAGLKKQISSCAPQTTDKAWYSSSTKAPLFPGLSGINFVITTNNQQAQAYFNQGMMLAYGFNHAEAARSFFQAIRLDSACAMAYWGFAYVLGPNYNAGMETDNYERAYVAAQKAFSLSASCTPKEKVLIKAMTYRYAAKEPKERSSLDIAYSTAMKTVYDQYTDDADISALYAESLMDMHPWDLYDKQTKEARPWTPEIVSILEHLIQLHPRHPGAPHFYIHAVEASQHPERALASANLLLTLVPGSGHLVHMPSHIYIWTGDYHLGSLANLEAVKIDSGYVESCHAQGAYPLSYFPHNYHYLSATATFEGNSKLAWLAAKKVQEHTAQEIMKEPGWGTLQHYYTIPYYVAVKFQMWDSILAMQAPENELVYPNAVLHYARGMAYLGKQELTKAENELAALKKLATDTVLKTITIWNINTTHELVQIAVKVLSAEIFQMRGQYEPSIALFQEAISLEDNLNYDEPPDWFFSVRHPYGAVLIKAGKFAAAQTIYLEDLKRYKENGWALIGLYHSVLKQGKKREAIEVKRRFDTAWRYADFKLASSSVL